MPKNQGDGARPQGVVPLLSEGRLSRAALIPLHGIPHLEDAPAPSSSYFETGALCGMSVAPETFSLRVHSARLRPRLSRRVEHLLVALGICLPVPVFAVTGLSVPLPTTVERLAAALVPWVNADATAEAQPVAGEIVRAPRERPLGVSPKPDSPLTNVRDEKATSRAGGETKSEEEAGEKGDGGKTAGVDGSGDSSNSGGSKETGGTSGGSTGGSDGGGLDLGTPVQGVVDTVGETTDPVLGDVGGTGSNVGGAVDDVLQGTNDTLTGALSGQK